MNTNYINCNMQINLLYVYLGRDQKTINNNFF